MSELRDQVDETTRADGRRLRRERSIAAVVDAALELLGDGSFLPTAELAAARSGVSPRSVYRYFPDQESLLHAAIDELWSRAVPAGHLHAIGEGPLEDRAVAYARAGVQVFEICGSGFRAGRQFAPQSVIMRRDLERARRVCSAQLSRQFRPELDALSRRARVLRGTMADVASQFDTIDVLRRVRDLTVQETVDVVTESLCLILERP